MKRNIFYFILGSLIFGSIGVLAGSYKANQISYTPQDSTWNVKNVKTALDDIKEDDKIEIANLQSALSNKNNVIAELQNSYDQVKNNDCVYGSFICTSCANSSGQNIETYFKPSKVFFYNVSDVSAGFRVSFYYDSTLDANHFYSSSTSTPEVANYMNFYDDHMILKNWGSNNVNNVIYYSYCK